MESFDQHLQLAEHFLEPHAAARWRSCLLIKSQKQLVAALRLFEHGVQLDKRIVRSISRSERSCELIVKRLRELGAPGESYLLSNDLNLMTGQSRSLEDGIQQALDSGFGTLVSCVPGKLGFFSGEFNDDGCLLVR